MKTGKNELILGFLVVVSSPIPSFAYKENTISRNLPVNVISGVHFIYPKVRDWIVIKED